MQYCSDSFPYSVHGSIECYAFVEVNIKSYMLRISKHCLATCAAEGPERVFIEGKPNLQSMCSHVLIEDVTSCEIQQSAVILVMWNQPVNWIKQGDHSSTNNTEHQFSYFNKNMYRYVE